MRSRAMRFIGSVPAAFVVVLALAASGSDPAEAKKPLSGREIFRFDTFGDEQLWTDTLRLNEALENVSPATALSVGLKVDIEALPPPIIRALAEGRFDVNDPRETRRLLKFDAVVGVQAKITGHRIKSVGITCALCHSTVDSSTGIGKRLDGWPNRDLRVGTIAALSEQLPEALRQELREWKPGFYDPRHHIFDGSNLQIINTPSIPVVIPPAYGLAGVGFETFTGDGPISYWNGYVGVTQMGGHGSFDDFERIGIRVTQTPDLVTPKLPALLAYQLSLSAPPPPPGSFDPAAAASGKALFEGKARCAECHVPPLYTDVMEGPSTPLLHDPAEVGSGTAYTDRSATGMLRTTPLRALWQHPPYFHDGRADDLPAVIQNYVDALPLVLSDEERNDLVEFLKSL